MANNHLAQLGVEPPEDVHPLRVLWAELQRSCTTVARLDALAAQLDAGELSQLEGSRLVDLLGKERDRLRLTAKVVLDNDVERRIEQLDQAQVDLLDDAITGIVTDLGHDPADPAVRRVVARNLKRAADRVWTPPVPVRQLAIEGGRG